MAALALPQVAQADKGRADVRPVAQRPRQGEAFQEQGFRLGLVALQDRVQAQQDQAVAQQ